MGKFTRFFVRTAKRANIIAVAVILAAQSLAFINFSSTKVLAAGEDVAYSGSNLTGLADQYIAISGLTVSGDGVDPVPVDLSVNRGELSMTTTTGITFNGDQTGDSLRFTGDLADVNAALATLHYRTIYAETVTLSASISQPGEVFYPGNGHLYEVVSSPGITADDALMAAAGLTKYGAQGYLATITTQEENDYVGPRLSGDGWFGARDSDVEGDWEWATGPETGTLFWQGIGGDGGAPVGGLYSNWASNEPNDAGDEDCAQFYSNGSGWNDLPCSGATLDYYVVEYGEDGSLPSVANASFTITTTLPPADAVPVGSCLDLIDVQGNWEDHRYDNLSLTADIDCTGETLEPMFSENDAYFGPLGFRGIFDGQGYEISNANISSISDNVGLFGNTDGATIQNLVLSDGLIEGDDCVGGLVGNAKNTTITDVVSSQDVNGNARVGGLVGCFDAEDGNSSLTDSSVSGDVTASELVGGLIGQIYAVDERTFTVDGNTYSGTINADDYNIGGVVGYIEASDDATITLTNNTVGGLGAVSGGTVGGVVGEIEIYDGGSTHIEANTLVGNISAEYLVGGVIGEAEAGSDSEITITNTHITTNVSTNDGYAGGLVGDYYAEGNEDTALIISDSSVTGNVSGTYNVGGLAGEIDRDGDSEQMTITGSYVTGSVTSTDGTAGGLVGDAGGMEIVSSYATGDVSGNGDVGGLLGNSNETTIEESYATGDVESTDDVVGGLVGRHTDDSYIIKSYATGDVVGTSRVGGLTGANGGVIEDSYARGNVTGEDNVGGLSGRCGGVIENSYSTGSVTGDTDIGGLVGYENTCETYYSYWDAETSGLDESASGEGLTTAEMKTKSTFTDDDFEDPWSFNEDWGMVLSVNDGYPCLIWQAEACEPTDDDEDGTTSSEENAAPNSGDANDDGTQDSQQANVAGYVNPVTNKYSVLDTPEDCVITDLTSAAESTNSTLDAGFTYPGGLMDFRIFCNQTPGFTVTVKQYYYGIPASSLVLRKYNPSTNAYFAVSTATITETSIGGQSVTIATYDITDGGELDVDGTVDGYIMDPAGLAASAVGAPNTGLGGGRR